MALLGLFAHEELRQSVTLDRHVSEDVGVIRCVAEQRAGGKEALKDAISAGEVPASVGTEKSESGEGGGLGDSWRNIPGSYLMCLQICCWYSEI